MFRIFKIEINRAFCNKLFIISLFIGCVITCLHFVLEAIPMIKYIPDIVEKNLLPHSVFNKWIGGISSFWGNLFFTVSPLLAAIPFADSFYSDRKSGYIKNIFTRINKKKYFISKFFAVFLSAGAVVVIPLLLNLYLTALCLPSVMPSVSTITFPLFAFSTWSEIFYTHPFVYIFLYMLLIFIVSGILASLALAFSYLIKFKYAVTLMPFLVFMFISFEASFFSVDSIDIGKWITPLQTVPLDFKIAIPEMAVLLLFVTGIYFIKGMRDDTF